MVSWAQHRKNTAQKSATTHPTSFGSSSESSSSKSSSSSKKKYTEKGQTFGDTGLVMPTGSAYIGNISDKSSFTPVSSSSGGGSSSRSPSSRSSSDGGGGSGGTYYKDSGTYVSTSGQGMSMLTPPKGAKIVSGIDPGLTPMQKFEASKGGGFSDSNLTQMQKFQASGNGSSYRGIPLPSGTKIEGSFDAPSPFVDPKTRRFISEPSTGIDSFSKFGTRTDLSPTLSPTIATQEIMVKPYIVQRQIDEYKGVPILETIYVDPTGFGEQRERKAGDTSWVIKEHEKRWKEYDKLYDKTKRELTEDYVMTNAKMTEKEFYLKTGMPERIKQIKGEQKFYEQQKIQAMADKVALSGAFPDTPKGNKEAEKYIKKMSRKDKTLKSKWAEFIAPAKETLSERIISKETEVKIQSVIGKALPYVVPIIGTLPEKIEKKATKFTAGAITAVIPKTVGELALDVGTFGVGAGIGAGLRLGEKGAGLVIRKIAPIIIKKSGAVTKAVKVGTGLFKGATTIGGIGLGGYYALGVGKQIGATETFEEKGAVFGKSAKSLLLFGTGYATGSKLATRGLATLKTKGRTEIEIQKLVGEDVLTGKEMFPSTSRPSVTKHYDVFMKQEHGLPITKLKGYTGKGELVYPKSFKDLPFKVPKGGYHATSPQFWAKGKGFEITPGKARVGEMVGLDISEQVSPHFLRSTGKYKFSFKDIFKDIFKPSGEGAIARVEPTSFKKGWGTKLGKAYVTGKKSEIQATIPTGTKVKFIEGKYYTTWKGTRVPIDYFKIQSIMELDNLTYYEVINIPGFGSEKANSLVMSWIKMKPEINKILKYIIIEFPELNKPFSGINFVITGKFENPTRKEIETAILSVGGILKNSVGKDTHYLVWDGVISSSKTKRAEKLQTLVITKDMIMGILGQNNTLKEVIPNDTSRETKQS